MKKYFLCLFLTLSAVLWGNSVFARDINSITDWYIKDFDTEIIVSADSSLSITENITADCGNLADKHGIFRVLPLETKTDKGIIKTPIELISITDFDGNPYNYQTVKDNNTITWKIGDADKTVSGENYYRITYRVKNAIRTLGSDFDELYWNLSGNYWDIDIDQFSAKIIFPDKITKENTQIYYYTGELGSKNTDLATYYWDKDSTLIFYSTTQLISGQGITLSATFPKGIITAYVPSFWEKYGEYFWYFSFLVPLVVLIAWFKIWQKHGKDPKIKSPIPPEFGIPENITPIQMGMIASTGYWDDKFITATIIDLAVKKFIIIEEKEEKILFLSQKKYHLKKAENYKNIDSLGKTEKLLLEKLFESGKDEIKISDLQNKFYKHLPAIKKSAVKDVEKWIEKNNSSVFLGFLAPIIGFLLMFVFLLLGLFSWQLIVGIIISVFISLFFTIFMPRRTQAGADLMFKIKGFERYMKQAEDYRQQFYEKENIFDKFLPYAIVFGIASLWAKKMQLIYGEEYYKNYHPVWFVGTNYTNFDVDSFTDQLNSITDSISQNTSSYSGSGGAGGAGGGGGGGGGGGW